MYPEGLLQRYADVGVDGIWLYAVLRELAPGGKAFPEFGEDWAAAPGESADVWWRGPNATASASTCTSTNRRAIEHSKAAEFFKNRPELRGVGDGLCTSQPAVRQWMSDALAHLFKNVPDLAGVFTITASENQTNCAWGGKDTWADAPAARTVRLPDIIAEVNTTIEAGVHRGNPQAKVFVWDWGWRNYQWDCKAIISKLPKSVYLLSISEFDKPIHRGGIRHQG